MLFVAVVYSEIEIRLPCWVEKWQSIDELANLSSLSITAVSNLFVWGGGDGGVGFW